MAQTLSQAPYTGQTVAILLIDLDRLDEADEQSPLFGVNRAALYSFHEKDHGARDGSSLRAYAERRAAEHGIDLSGGCVLLLVLAACCVLGVVLATRFVPGIKLPATPASAALVGVACRMCVARLV